MNPKPNAQKNAKLKERRDQKKRKMQAGSDSDSIVELKAEELKAGEPVKDKELKAEAATGAPAAGKATKAEWKAAGNEANFRSIAAMKQVLALHAMFGGASSADEAEQLTKQGWMSVLLFKGCCYMYQDSTEKWHRFVSLGFYGYAASCWLLSSTEVNCEGETKLLLKLSGWQPSEEEDAPPTQSFHFTGHQVKALHDSGRLFGIKTEVALPCMTGSNGLGWFCQTEVDGEPDFPGKQDVILFALQKGAPLSTAQLVLLADSIDQVDQAPCDLPPSTLADPSLLDILLLFQMKARLPGGLPSDAQSVLTAAHRHVVREANWTHSRYKASWGEHNACA